MKPPRLDVLEFDNNGGQRNFLGEPFCYSTRALRNFVEHHRGHKPFYLFNAGSRKSNEMIIEALSHICKIINPKIPLNEMSGEAGCNLNKRIQFDSFLCKSSLRGTWQVLVSLVWRSHCLPPRCWHLNPFQENGYSYVFCSKTFQTTHKKKLNSFAAFGKGG